MRSAGCAASLRITITKYFFFNLLIYSLLAPGKPINLTANATSSKNLLIRWKQPDPPNGVIKEYNLSLCLIIDGNNEELTDCGNLSNILVSADVTQFNTSDKLKLCKWQNR